MKKGEFIAISYVGKVPETGEIFDLTDEALARKVGLFNDKVIYGPMVVVLGSGHMLAGLEEAVMGMEAGQRKTVVLQPAHAFGERDPQRVQTLPEKLFRDQAPKPGLVINIQGLLGKVQSVSGGRVVIDFNHPLAGKQVEYDVTVEKAVTDPAEQFGGILRLHSRKGQNDRWHLSGDTAEVALPADNPMPAEVMKELAGEARKYIPQIKRVKFTYSFE